MVNTRKGFKLTPTDKDKRIEELTEQNTSLLTSVENLNKSVQELEDKLANADYQLEGRDLEIKELKLQIEKMKCCEICAKSKDWRNRSLCIECEKSKSHINFELRR